MKLLNGYELTTTFWNDFSLIDDSYDSKKNNGSCEKSRIYNELWLEAKNFAETNLSGQEKDFFKRITD